MQAQEAALATQTKLGMILIYHGSASRKRPCYCNFFLSQSFSISNWPILAYNFSVSASFWASTSGSGPEKTAAALLRNSFFQVLI
jgi:hypothetical protein